MNKQELALLERAFVAEIDGAVNGAVDLMQTKSKLAAKLVDEGYLDRDEYTLPGRMPITLKGYRLTHLGRITYCATCTED